MIETINPTDKQHWLRIPEYDDYEVSQSGKVRSLKFGKVRLLKGCPDQDGYLAVYLCAYGNIKRIKISKIVAKVFIPNPKNLPVVNHLNGIKNDDRVENLEWCTHEENRDHAIRTGLINNKGEKNPSAKLNEIEAEKIRNMYATGKYSQRDIAKIFTISQRTILRVLKNRVWRNSCAK